ncbi:unnamed protein product [Haemonchus placei]|uniref:MYND-type domain-containing protein n=1 Tax=Haemonchus placei TaxID=6290 RepID=A0A158QJY2_HAEPC|nr:unnamed protein product [Haemonchus placei]
MVSILRRCLGCGFALFCNKDCQSLGWKDHKAECKGLRKAQVIPDIETRMLGRIVLRHKEICAGKDKKTEGFYKDRTSERSILEIWAHTDKIRKDSYAMKKFEEIYESLTKFYEEKFMMSKDVVFELHCRDYINRHAISDKGYVKSDNRAEICIFGEHSYKNIKSSVLTCERCGNEVPKDYVVEAVNAMRFIDQIFEDRELEQVSKMPSKTRVEFLEDLLERFTKILSGCNIYLCKLVQVWFSIVADSRHLQNLIPLIDPNNNQDLLRLHLRSENCVRRCFPKNHPAIAFHLRFVK